MFLSILFTNTGKPLGVLFLTDFHRWTEAFLWTGRAGREELAPPLPLPRREGRDHRDTPMANHQHPTLNTQHPSFSSNALFSLYAEGVLWARHCAPKISVNSVGSVREKNIQHERMKCLLWEKKLPCNFQASFLLQWVRSISHRITQMNRTHKASQRH